MPRIKIVVKVDPSIETQETVVVVQPSTPKGVKHLQPHTWAWENEVPKPPED
jgi:hypothetical protein